MAEQIALALDHLRTATDQLLPSGNGLDLDRMEAAVAVRQQAVSRLSELIALHPDAFTHVDLERVRSAHQRGKRAMEKLLKARQSGWVTATELSQREHVVRSFARFNSPGDKSGDSGTKRSF